MGIQMSFLGSDTTSTITGVSVAVEAINVGATASAGVSFRASGMQQTTRNSSLTFVGNWVTPAATAGQWEIRATLDGGTSPTSGSLGVWQALSADRTWTVVAQVGENIGSLLTFEFRKVGASVAEFTIAGNFISARASSILEP